MVGCLGLENLLKDSFKAEAREREFRNQEVELGDPGISEEFDFPVEVDGAVPALSRRAQLAAKFLEEEVSEEDADLIRLSVDFFDFARNEPVIDDALLDGVCQRMGLKPSGIRSRRKRISMRLRDYIERHE